MKTNKLKVCELTDAALDWAVAKCKGLGLGPRGFVVYYDNNGEPATWQPSTIWSQGGPIIERERMTLRVDTRGGFWVAFLDGDHVTARQRGETSLIAAMRCFVASKLGDEVEIPEELT